MYSMKDIYPNMGAINTFDNTVPDPDEQVALAHVDESDKASLAVDPAKKKSVYTWLGIFLILCVLFHLGR